MNPDDLDGQFKQGRVSRDALDALLDAEASNSAASIGWLEGRLRTLEDTVARRPLHIDVPGASRTLISAADFAAWCRKRFPNAYGIPSPSRPEQQVYDWIHENLIDGGRFAFNGPGASSLGESLELYSTPLIENSVLMAAMAGAVAPAPFRVSELLAVLKDAGGAEPASWIWCAENSRDRDAGVGHVQHFDGKVWPFDDAYAQPQMIARFEEIKLADMRDGKNFLQLLLPGTRRWLLVSQRKLDSFRMELRGERAMLDDVRRQLRLART